MSNKNCKKNDRQQCINSKENNKNQIDSKNNKSHSCKDDSENVNCQNSKKDR